MKPTLFDLLTKGAIRLARAVANAPRLVLIGASLSATAIATPLSASAAMRLATAADLVNHRILVLSAKPTDATAASASAEVPPGDSVVAVQGKLFVMSKRDVDTLISNGFVMLGDLLPNYESCPDAHASSVDDGSKYGDRWIWEHEYLDHLLNGGILGFLTPDGEKVFFYYGDYHQYMEDNYGWGCGRRDPDDNWP